MKVVSLRAASIGIDPTDMTGGKPNGILHSVPKWALLIIVLGCLLLIIAAVVVTARVSLGNAVPVESLVDTPRGPAQIVRFTVYDVGIFPSEARVRPGSVVIRLEDLSGDATALMIQSETRQVIGQIVRGEGRWRGSNRLTLAAGRYEISDAGHSRKRATLIVEPQ